MYTAWWLFWICLQTLVLHHLSLSWQIAITDSLVSNIILAACCFVAITLYRYYQPSNSNRIYRFVFTLSITILYTVSFKWVISFVLSNSPVYLEFLDKSMPIRVIIALLVLSFLTITNWLLYNLQEKTESEQRRNDAEQLAKEAELAKLRQQIQPHFLFNSLNSISALAGTKPTEARKMIQQLSDFLRGTLKKDEQQSVLLSEELEHLQLYLEIEKVRFGHRLQIEFHTALESLKLELPPLLLQPIVENAIKFGLYDRIDDVTISVRSYVENNNLCIQIINPFDEETQLANEGTGFGLNSIQRRLFLLYARNDLMLLEKANQLFTTTLKIPQNKK